jgi:acetate kinase
MVVIEDMMTIFDPRKNMFTLYDPVNSESRGVDINEIRSSQLDYACFLLYNGGELITESVTRVDTGTMERIKESIHLLPEYNRNTYQALTEIASEVPEIPCFLLCETAFFTRLPSEVAAYAVPAFLKDKGMKRFGGHGLFHEYILQELKAHDNHSTKIISIYLGNYPHMAASGMVCPLKQRLDSVVWKG